MPDHNFSRPWSETRYVPRFFRADDDRISWDLANNDNVADELEHVILCIRGKVFSLQVGTLAPGLTDKIALIKAIRQDLGVGLKQAKDIAEGEVVYNLSHEDTVRYENAWHIYGARIRVFNSSGLQVRGERPSAVREDAEKYDSYAEIPF